MTTHLIVWHSHDVSILSLGRGGLSSTWWAVALSLAERRITSSTPAPRCDDAAVRERLNAWRRSGLESAAGDFTARLNLRGLTEEQLIAALGEPPETIAARVERPAWVDVVETAIAGVRAGSGQCTPAGDWTAAFASIFEPFVAAARDRLLRHLSHGWPAAVVRPATLDGLGRWLGQRLVHVGSRTLVLELHRARQAGLISGPDPEARFRDFVRRAATPEHLAELMSTYPVLARLLATTSLHAVNAWAELLRRFEADRAAIVSTLLGDVDPGCLIRVECGVGDMHLRGRSTCLLHFEGGTTIVYKPRSLEPHLRFTGLLEWLNTALAGLDLRPVPALAREGYGWLSFVTHQACRSAEGVERFYYRQGALMALAYAIDGADLHHGNLIACADQPMIVDTETVFHPDLAPPASTGDPANRAIGASVVRLLLLPWIAADERGVVDLSGMGGEAGQNYHANEWTDAGTDRMRLREATCTVPSYANRPLLGSHEIDSIDHEDAILAGFKAAYQTIVAHRSRILSLVAAAADDEIRVVAQSTSVYAALLADATHPDALRDGLDHDRVFDRLCVASLHDPIRRRLVPLELVDLWAGDVPLFRGRPGSRDLIAGDGERVVKALPAPAIIAVQKKIAAMGPADRHCQGWMIKAALAARRERLRPVCTAPLLHAPQAAFDSERCVAAARAVADELVDRAIRGDGVSNWLGFDLIDGAGWVVSGMGAGLSDGYCGVALFLGQLADVLSEPSYAELAWSAVRQLPDLLEGLATRPAHVDAVGCGGLDGFAGIAYAAARLGTLLDRAALFDIASIALRLAAQAVSPAAPLGLASGVAGCLAASLAIHAETGAPDAARLALLCADRLVGCVTGRADLVATLASKDLLDVGFALWRAGAWMESAAYEAAGLDALRLGLKMYRRAGGGDGLGWCQGIAAAVLAHAEIRPSVDGGGLGQLLARLIDRPMRRDLSLCHGEFGIIDALLVDPHAGEAWRDQAARIIATLNVSAPVCGTPGGVATPGLLRGLSGVGYELLRLGRPDRVPSVLTLSPRVVGSASASDNSSLAVGAR